MARPNGAYEFVNGSVRHHTKRIKPGEWEKWRPVITELFLEFKLAEIVTRMQLEHGFSANKWGVRKQNLGTATTATPSSAHPDAPGPGLRDTSKRPRHCASIDSFSGAESTLLKPPRKRLDQEPTSPNNTEQVVPLERSGHAWVQYESCGTVSTSPSATNTTFDANIESPSSSHDSMAEEIPDTSTDFAIPNADNEVRIPSQADRVVDSRLSSPQTEKWDPIGLYWPLPPTPFVSEAGKHIVLDNQQVPSVPTLIKTAESSLRAPLSEGDNLAEPSVLPNTPVPPLAASTSQGSSTYTIPAPAVTRELRTIDRNRPVWTFSA